MNQLTALNVRKVTRFRQGGIEALEDAISKLKITKKKGDAKAEKAPREETESS